MKSSICPAASAPEPTTAEQKSRSWSVPTRGSANGTWKIFFR
ncbi:hypothetical protein [Nocardioides pyridinolyticus]